VQGEMDRIALKTVDSDSQKIVTVLTERFTIQSKLLTQGKSENDDLRTELKAKHAEMDQKLRDIDLLLVKAQSPSGGAGAGGAMASGAMGRRLPATPDHPSPESPLLLFAILTLFLFVLAYLFHRFRIQPIGISKSESTKKSDSFRDYQNNEYHNTVPEHFRV